MPFEGYIPMPWQYEVERTQAPAAPADSPDMVTIPQKEWLRAPAGPVPLDGKGMLLTGGPPSAPQPMVPWAPRPGEGPDMTPLIPPEAIRELFARVPPAEALKAVEAATQLEGILGFDADRKAGVPVPEALLKWGPKMYHRNPSAVVAMQNALRPFKPSTMTVGGHELIQTGPNRFQVAPRAMPEGPIEAEAITGPEGRVLGYGVRGAGGAVHPLREPTPARGATPRDLVTIARTRLESIKQEIADATYGLGGAKKDPARVEELRAERNSILSDLKKLGAGTPVTSPAAKPAPAVGTIVRGYRFKGGDPAKKESWEKVQ